MREAGVNLVTLASSRGRRWVVDENNQVRQPAYPCAFRALIGAYIDEYWPARAGEEFTVSFADGVHR